MSCPARRSARWLTNGNIPVYLYHFTHVIDAVEFFDSSLGVFHGSELVFVWYLTNYFLIHRDLKVYTYDGLEIPLPLTYSERNLQQTFVKYWTNFAKTGNPNGDDPYIPVQWPNYKNETDQSIRLDLKQSVQTHLKKSKCDFWDEYFEDTWNQ